MKHGNQLRIFALAVLFCSLFSGGAFSQLSGTYTIGGTTPDYATFTAAVNDLVALGVSGPVTFDVANGTYTEQVTIGSVSGTSLTNTVTFRSASGDSNAVWLRYNAAGTGDNWTLKLSGCEYLRFERITIGALNSSFGDVMLLENATGMHTFEGCVFATPDQQGTLVYSGSLANSDSLRFLGSRFMGGIYGIRLDGVSAGDREEGLEITGNEFRDQYSYPIDISRHTSPVIGGNYIVSDVFNNNNATGINFNNVYAGSGNNPVINGNIIELSHGIGMTIRYSSGDTSLAEFTNNRIYIEGDSTFLRNTALLMINGSGQTFYNNTFVVLDSGGVNSKTVSVEDWAGSGSQNRLYNNIICNYSGGYTIWVEDTMIFTHIDHNDHWAGLGRLGHWIGTDYDNLTDWRAGTGKDLNSVRADPMFYDWRSDYHICNPTLNGIGKAGLPLSVDMDMEPRPFNPDIGADEFTPLTNLFIGNDTVLCPGDSLPLDAGQYLNGSYLWSTGETTQSVMVSDTSAYWVMVYSQCDTIYDTISVGICVAITEPAEQVLAAWPNPATDLLNLAYSNSLAIGQEYLVMNSMGGIVMRGRFDNDREILDISGLAKGVYFIRLKEFPGQVLRFFKF